MEINDRVRINTKLFRGCFNGKTGTITEVINDGVAAGWFKVLFDMPYIIGQKTFTHDIFTASELALLH